MRECVSISPRVRDGRRQRNAAYRISLRGRELQARDLVRALGERCVYQLANVLEPTYDWQISLAFGTALEQAMRGGDIEAAQAEADATITRVIADLGLADQK